MALSGLAPLERGMTFASFRVSDGNRGAYRAAVEWSPSWRGIAFAGPSGSGKTHLAAAMVNGLVGAGICARFASVPRLLDRMRADFSRVAHTVEALTAGCDVLALDDLGAEKSTDWTNDRLYLIINERVRRCVPIIYTTNYPVVDGGELADRVGSRIVSRILRTCDVHVVKA